MTDLSEPSAGDLDMSVVMQAFGDRVRLQIVRSLADGQEKQCGSFQLGVAKATRSHHFRVLREAGITHTRIDGTARFLSLRSDDLQSRFPGLLDAVLQSAPLQTARV